MYLCYCDDENNGVKPRDEFFLQKSQYFWQKHVPDFKIPKTKNDNKIGKWI